MTAEVGQPEITRREAMETSSLHVEASLKVLSITTLKMSIKTRFSRGNCGMMMVAAPKTCGAHAEEVLRRVFDGNGSDAQVCQSELGIHRRSRASSSTWRPAAGLSRSSRFELPHAPPTSEHPLLLPCHGPDLVMHHSDLLPLALVTYCHS